MLQGVAFLARLALEWTEGGDHPVLEVIVAGDAARGRY